MLSVRLLDVGTKREHLKTLLDNWVDGLRVMEERFTEPNDSASITEKFKCVRGSIKLLREHIDKLTDDSSDTVYRHIADLLEGWQIVLEDAKSFKSTNCKAVATQLKFSCDYIFNYLKEDTSDYELLKLVNSADK